MHDASRQVSHTAAVPADKLDNPSSQSHCQLLCLVPVSVPPAPSGTDCLLLPIVVRQQHLG